jgi:hypothetical protein
MLMVPLDERIAARLLAVAFACARPPVWEALRAGIQLAQADAAARQAPAGRPLADLYPGLVRANDAVRVGG